MVDSVVGSVAGSVVGAVVAAVVGAVVAAVVEVVVSVGSAGVLQAHRRRQNISNKGRIRFMLKDPFLKISVIIANLILGRNCFSKKTHIFLFRVPDAERRRKIMVYFSSKYGIL